MNVLGIKFLNHDAGAALIAGERVMAISEERLNRVKHSPNTFPLRSIDYCLQGLGLKHADITLVVTDAVSHDSRLENFRKESEAKIRSLFPNADFRLVNHHDAHAASAFFCSPFREAAVLVHDGAGEQFHSPFGGTVAETDTTYYGEGNRLYEIHKTVHPTKGNTFSVTTGIGWVYSWLTVNYLGLGSFNEGKMMGLAPYGDTSILEQFPLERWCKEYRGELFCNPKLSYVPPSFLVMVQKITSVRKLFKVLMFRVHSMVRNTRRSRQDLFEEIVLPNPPRPKSLQLPDQYYSSVAYAGQKVLEEVTLRVCSKLFGITRSTNIAIAGGVGLNIDANTRIINETGFKHIFIQPAASDCGIPLGAALWGFHVILGRPRFFTMTHAYLGKSYEEGDIHQALAFRAHEISFSKSSSIAKDTASILSEGNIVGWFQGASEYGPRALGHRSILADARVPEMRDIVNKRVKHREMWRPFAASVLKERVGDFFDLTEESPFMILLATVPQEKRTRIPSVVHVDGTCRIQTLTKEANGLYYDLVNDFYSLTGVPLVLNTSFNLAGEPIVETPTEALDSFLRTDMDYLVMGHYIITKKKPATA